MSREIIEKMTAGNLLYLRRADKKKLEDAALRGQRPYAIVICCSDSRVIPEEIFSASLGELFVIRVAGNVLDNHQLGSVEYAAAHLGSKLVVVLGHTCCGAVSAALSGHGGGYIEYITEDILKAVGSERDPDAACRLNVMHGAERIRREFSHHPEMAEVDVRGAVYDIKTGMVTWL